MRVTACLFFLLIIGFPVLTSAQSDLDTSAFDRSVRAQDDLFLHVNGAWLEKTQIPSDKSNYGSFTKFADLSQDRIRELIENLSSQNQRAWFECPESR